MKPKIKQAIRLTIGAILILMTFLIGVSVGPRLHAMFWSARFQTTSDPWLKLLYASNLSRTEYGKERLYYYVEHGDPAVQSICVTALANTEMPWKLWWLLGSLREQGSMYAYSDVLNAMDYSQFHRQALNILRNEYQHCSDATIKKKIKIILDKFACPDDPAVGELAPSN